MAQSTQTIRGHIADIASGEPIIGVAVLVDSEGIGGSSDLDGNALSGVFDIKMRSGNNTKYEHAFQIGTLGFDIASEGPLGKKGKTKASYLVNYRYSFLKVACELKAINMDNEIVDQFTALTFPNIGYRVEF